MTEKDTFTQRTLERIRASERNPESQKKRKLSKIILVLDGIIVAVVLVYFFSKDDKINYKTTTVQYKSYSFRYSISGSVKRPQVFSLSIKSKAKVKTILALKKHLATIEIKHKNILLLSKNLDTPKKILLSPGESKTFVTLFQYNTIKNAIMTKTPFEMPRRTLLSTGGKNVTLNTTISIYAGEKIATTLPFNFEVAHDK